MADKFEIDLDVTAEAKQRIKRMFQESLISAEVERLQKATLPPTQISRMDQFVGAAGSIASGIGTARNVGANVASGNIGGAISGLSGAASMIGGPIAGAVAEVAGQIASAIQDAFHTAVGFIRDFNPGGVELLDQAFKDISGVIGRSLNPLLQVFIPLVRGFGDMLATMLPDLSGFVAALQPFVENTREYMKLIGSIGGVGIQKLVNALELLVRAFGYVAKAITYVIEKINEIPGVNRFQSSTGAAAGGAQSSSIADFGKSLQLAAYGMSSSPEQKTATNTEKMADLLELFLPQLAVPNKIFAYLMPGQS